MKATICVVVGSQSDEVCAAGDWWAGYVYVCLYVCTSKTAKAMPRHASKERMMRQSNAAVLVVAKFWRVTTGYDEAVVSARPTCATANFVCPPHTPTNLPLLLIKAALNSLSETSCRTIGCQSESDGSQREAAAE